MQGSTTCLPCPLGHTCSDPTQLPVPCDPGSYAHPAGRTTCTPCPVGHSCRNPTSAPVACPLGSYSNALGAAACIPCEAGYKCPNADGSGIAPCAAGTYSLPGSSACTPSPPGHYAPHTDRNLVIPCPPGTYSSGGVGTYIALVFSIVDHASHFLHLSLQRAVFPAQQGEFVTPSLVMERRVLRAATPPAPVCASPAPLASHVPIPRPTPWFPARPENILTLEQPPAPPAPPGGTAPIQQTPRKTRPALRAPTVPLVPRGALRVHLGIIVPRRAQQHLSCVRLVATLSAAQPCVRSLLQAPTSLQPTVSPWPVRVVIIPTPVSPFAPLFRLDTDPLRLRIRPLFVLLAPIRKAD